MINKKSIGQKGEEIACKALEKDGYRIVEKNFRCRQGEIDIIVEEKGVICFIEVNPKQSTYFLSAGMGNDKELLQNYP